MSNDDVVATVHKVFHQHLEERELWPEVVEVVKVELANMLRTCRISGKVEGRAKSTGSVVGKTMRKPQDYGDISAFGDLAAARALVPFPSNVEPLAAEIHRHPGFTVREDDAKRRPPDSLRYQARHLDLEVDWAYFRPDATSPPRPLRCEVQIQTLAQSLWAGVSHLVTYKRDQLPEDVHLRVNRLIVLCELFDDEIEVARDLALANVDVVGQITQDVVRYYSSITGITMDSESILQAVGLLVGALAADEVDTYPSVLEQFVSDFGERLAHLLTHEPLARGNPWFVRPEALFAFERLHSAPARFAAVWDQAFSPADRLALADAWGPEQ